MVQVKVCGITRLEDAMVCVEAGADALGFVFYEPSPRFITPETAAAIAERLPPFVVRVGVFVDAPAEEMEAIARLVGLDCLQLHGQEPPELCASLSRRVLKAVRVGERLDFPFESYQTVGAFLLDTYVPGLPGGTGQAFRWELAQQAKRYGRIVLAGGLTPENVAEAIQIARPDGVDVSSGVEAAPGRKDPAKVRAFLRTVRESSAVL
ncbi:MAG: N-(5'-phosphoribosyl)anthranilate isomerase [Candidatus Poribacteria bacterium]|nr:MAG: N-(5'-phosphoribosyl)anthranilate isomerase [Candidatus Poribacteria bacterium]